MALPGEHGLRNAVAAHRARNGPVGENGVSVALHVVARVKLRERAHALCGDAMAMGGICALVREALHLPGGKCAVGPDVGDDMRADGMAHAVGNEGLLPADVKLYAPAAHLRGKVSAERLIQRILLVAEAAADVRLDDAHIAPRDAQRLPHDAPHDVRDLRGGGDDDAPALHLRKADVVFNVAVLHGGGVVPAFHPDEAGLLDRRLIVALHDARVGKNVVRIVFMQLRRTRLHGLLGIEDERVLLVFHADGSQRLCRRDLVFRNNGRNIVPVEAHAAREEQPVSHILMVRVGGPGVPRRREFILRHIEAGDDLHHSFDLLRRARIDLFHHAVCDRGMQHLCNERVLRAEVVRIARAACYLIERIHALFAFSNGSAHAFSSLSVSVFQKTVCNGPVRITAAQTPSSLHRTALRPSAAHPESPAAQGTKGQ